MTVYEIVQEYHAAWDEAYAHYFAFIALGVGATAFGGLLMSLLKKRVFRWSGATLALVGLCFATYTVFSPYIASGGDSRKHKGNRQARNYEQLQSR